jgi:hypothetical protein
MLYILVRAACMCCHWTKCPLLTVWFLLLLSFRQGYFSPRRVYRRVLKFCMGFQGTKKEEFGWKQIWGTPCPNVLVLFLKRKVLRIVLQTHVLTNFCRCWWGAERRVNRVQTWEQGPPSSPAEIGNCNFIHDPNQSHSMRKVRSFIPHGTILKLILDWGWHIQIMWINVPSIQDQ